MEIENNLTVIRKKICMAAEAAGRDPNEIGLIAVSKTKPVSMIQEAVRCGAKVFGENRPQELAEKFSQVSGVQWHLIGQLQRNKVKYIIDKAALIHSVDSFALAQEIEKRASAKNLVQDILIQVNVSGEETKSGICPEETAGLCREISRLSHVRIRGLMTISVRGASEEENHRIFGGLRRLSEEIAALGIPGVCMKELSMGMTHDFEAAIAEGATLIRVGTGIFGGREKQI